MESTDFSKLVPALKQRIQEFKTKEEKTPEGINIAKNLKNGLFVSKEQLGSNLDAISIDEFISDSLKDLEHEVAMKKRLESLVSFIKERFENIKKIITKEIDAACQGFLNLNVYKLPHRLPTIDFFENFANGEFNEDSAFLHSLEELSKYQADPPVHVSFLLNETSLMEAFVGVDELLVSVVGNLSYKTVTCLEFDPRLNPIKQRKKCIRLAQKVNRIKIKAFKMPDKLSIKEGISTNEIAKGKFWMVDCQGNLAIVDAENNFEVLLRKKAVTISTIGRVTGTYTLARTMEFFRMEQKSFFCYNCITVSPSGTKFAVSGSDSMEIVVLASSTGNNIQKWPGESITNFLRIITWLDDNRLMAGYEDGLLRVFSVQNPGSKTKFYPLKNTVYSICASDGGTHVFIGYKNGSVLSISTIETEENQMPRWVSNCTPGHIINTLALSGSILAAGGAKKECLLISASSGHLIERISHSTITAEILKIDWSPNQKNMMVLTEKEAILVLMSESLEWTSSSQVGASDCGKNAIFVSGRVNWSEMYAVIGDSNGDCHQVIFE